MALSMSEITKATIVPLLLIRKEEVNNNYSLWWNGFSSAYHAERSTETRKEKLELIFSSEPDEVINLFFMLKHRLRFRDSDLEEPFLRHLLEGYWDTAVDALEEEKAAVAGLQAQVTSLLANLPQTLWSVDVIHSFHR